MLVDGQDDVGCSSLVGSKLVAGRGGQPSSAGAPGERRLRLELGDLPDHGRQPRLRQPHLGADGKLPSAPAFCLAHGLRPRRHPLDVYEHSPDVGGWGIDVD